MPRSLSRYAKSDQNSPWTQSRHEEGVMLVRLFQTVTHLGGSSDLNWYLVNLHRANGSTAPTRDEANRDYAATMRAAASPWSRF